MKHQLNVAIVLAVAAGLISAYVPAAKAGCAQDDFICEKFARKKVAPASTPRRQKAQRPRRSPAPAVAAERPSQAIATHQSTRAIHAGRPSPANAPTPPIRTSLNNAVPVAPVPFSITTLRPGAITAAPADTSNLIFGSGDQVEIATARCEQIESSKRRVSCAVAIHQLALTSETGAGCTGSLGLRQLEFVRSESGDWVSEDSIALCGGRLLRRTELFPVAVGGTPRYALREAYQMLGGDRTCAAPYLRSRQPLNKSYMPVGTNRSGSQSLSLTCGAVATR